MSSIKFDINHKPKIGQAESIFPDIQVITAPNASFMTFTGTRTYLVGGRSGLCIIDPGPSNQQHLKSIMRAVGDRQITHILITHSHSDHSPLSRDLAKKTKAPIYGFGSPEKGRSALMKELILSSQSIGGTEGLDLDYKPDIILTDNMSIIGDGWEIIAIYTPGHLSDHFSFALPARNVLFSGDLIMGWSTTLISPPDGDVNEFCKSLKKLLLRQENIYLPGHGKPVFKAKDMVTAQLKHREYRKQQILKELTKGPASPLELAKRIYTRINPTLIPAATRNVFAHLIDLLEHQKIDVKRPISKESSFRILKKIVN